MTTDRVVEAWLRRLETVSASSLPAGDRTCPICQEPYLKGDFRHAGPLHENTASEYPVRVQSLAPNSTCRHTIGRRCLEQMFRSGTPYRTKCPRCREQWFAPLDEPRDGYRTGSSEEERSHLGETTDDEAIPPPRPRSPHSTPNPAPAQNLPTSHPSTTQRPSHTRLPLEENTTEHSRGLFYHDPSQRILSRYIPYEFQPTNSPVPYTYTYTPENTSYGPPPSSLPSSIESAEHIVWRRHRIHGIPEDASVRAQLRKVRNLIDTVLTADGIAEVRMRDPAVMTSVMNLAHGASELYNNLVDAIEESYNRHERAAGREYD